MATVELMELLHWYKMVERTRQQEYMVQSITLRQASMVFTFINMVISQKVARLQDHVSQFYFVA
jgi:hypothetical protein